MSKAVDSIFAFSLAKDGVTPTGIEAEHELPELAEDKAAVVRGADGLLHETSPVPAPATGSSRPAALGETKLGDVHGALARVIRDAIERAMLVGDVKKARTLTGRLQRLQDTHEGAVDMDRKRVRPA